MRCGEACFNNKNCNFFTFGSNSSICYLKTVSDTSKIVSNLGNICGMIEKRIIKLPQPQPTLPPPKILSAYEISAKYGDSWMTSADGTYAYLYWCDFRGNNTKTYESTKTNDYGDFKGTYFDYCARACEDQRDICDHFVWYRSDTSEVTCFLKKNPTGVILNSSGNFLCGVMTNLPRSSPTTIPNFNNVEFMPKCNYELSNATYTFYGFC